jgi:K+-sensing histidine kinase KdpD
MSLATSVEADADQPSRRDSLRQISHDLRNALTILDGNLDTIRALHIKSIERPLDRLFEGARRVATAEGAISALIKGE